jgi:hypothetical protein
MGTWESIGTLETSEFDCKVKTLRMEAFFISLESYRSVYVENGLAWTIWTSPAQVMAKRKAGSQPNPNACRWSVTSRWKALDESYKIALDLIPIRSLSKELWPRKVAGVQIGTTSRLLLGSPGIKSHLDVGVVERCR